MRESILSHSSEQPPTNLIALRDGKQRAEALITARYAEGLIDGDELERRLERLYDADSLAALERLIVDLVEPGTEVSAALVVPAPEPRPSVALAGSSVALARPGSSVALARPGSSVALARLDDIAPRRQITALFSSVEQTGSWVPARHNRVLDVFGEAKLDLRTAALGPGVTHIELRCVFASMTLVVPPQLAVRVEADVVFGSIERDSGIAEHPQGPDDPIVVVTGLVLFASLEIRERLVGESKREARRRRKALRKAAKRRAPDLLR